ncbi:hypothetical protein MAJJADAN_00069 [Pseudomonas phage Amjad_SA]|nr:hypothetical protein MAJJADAN_00069 [Pseudomonas phage Amjad_SA]
MSGRSIGGGNRGSMERSEARIPQDQVDDANRDIVAVIGKYVQLKKSGKNWSACCPFHSEKSPSFSVSEEKGIFYCFGCGAGEDGKNDAVGFVMRYTGLGFREAVESINGRITLEGGAAIQPAKSRAIRCTLPGHAEDPEKAARAVGRAKPAPQHAYLLRNNTAPCGDVLELKGSLIVPLINNIGEQVNAAAITVTGITYAAGKPSFGSTAILEPAAEHDGKVIICADYAHAWRIWWAQGGRSRVLCAMQPDNLSWMLANCRDRFTHVGCDPLEADWYVEEGHGVVAVPVMAYAARCQDQQASARVDCREACA